VPLDPQPSESPEDRYELLRHELKTPLTVIRGEVFLVRRRLARMDGMTEVDRTWLLDHSARIDVAILDLVARIERIGREVGADPGALSECADDEPPLRRDR
jgi:hypothetical protein